MHKSLYQITFQSSFSQSRQKNCLETGSEDRITLKGTTTKIVRSLEACKKART